MKHVARGIDPDASMFGRLRQLLDEAEREIVVMGETPGGVLAVINDVDQIDEALGDLKSPWIDTRAEQSRVDGLHGRLTREAQTVAKLVQRHGHAAALAGSPTWQAVQATAAERQRKQWRRRLLIGGVAAVLAVLVFVVVPWVFPPTPQVDTTAIAQQAANNSTDSALALALAEHSRVPNDPQGALWLGALYAKQGDTAAANAAWKDAQRLFADDTSFYFNRATVLLQLSDYDGVAADAQRLIATPSSAAYGYYLRGEIGEARNQNVQALQDYQQAATLADQINNAQLSVTARTRMGYLMQRPNLQATPMQ